MNNLRKIRKEKNLTQAELGKLVNLTEKEISRKELGITQLTEEQIKILCKALQVRADLLLGLDEE